MKIKICLFWLAITAIFSGSANAEIYHGVSFSEPFNATESHITNFDFTTVDRNHRPMTIGGSMIWHNTNSSADKDAIAIDNALLENGAIAKLMRYLRYLNATEINQSRSAIANEMKSNISAWTSPKNIVIESIIINASMLMPEEFKCYWQTNESSSQAPKKDISESPSFKRDIAMLVVGMVASAIAFGLGSMKKK